MITSEKKLVGEKYHDCWCADGNYWYKDSHTLVDVLVFRHTLISCVDCINCIDCVSCTRCHSCIECINCTDSVLCSDSSDCINCVGCENSYYLCNINYMSNNKFYYNCSRCDKTDTCELYNRHIIENFNILKIKKGMLK